MFVKKLIAQKFLMIKKLTLFDYVPLDAVHEKSIAKYTFALIFKNIEVL